MCTLKLESPKVWMVRTSAGNDPEKRKAWDNLTEDQRIQIRAQMSASAGFIWDDTDELIARTPGVYWELA